MDTSQPGEPQKSNFPPTRWSLVLRVAGSNENSAREALEEICRIYWSPVYSFLRQSGHQRQDAEDLTQGFFSELVAGNLLRTVSRERGHLRSFLLACLKRFLSREFQKAHAQKRGGNALTLSLDYRTAEHHHIAALVEDETPEAHFDRSWAAQVMSHAREALAKRYEASGKAEQFRELSAFLSWNNTNAAYRGVAERLGISETNLRTSVYRLRRHFREALLEEIGNTVASKDQAEEELTNLLEILRAK